MEDVFSNVWGQRSVREHLRTAARNGQLSHAYLFCGPAGSGKTAAAYALAAAALCEDDGCGQCEQCRRIVKRLHPDVHYFAPEGAQAYLIGQVRDILGDIVLAPIQAPGKVYIIDRADLLNASAANALLKTLEEPPHGVTLVLLARTVDAVLPTIVSRCQVVPFRTVPESESIGLVAQNAGVSPERARVALAACDGSAERAVAFAQSNERMDHARKVFASMAALRHADDWDVIKMSKELVSASDAPLDDVRREQEEYLEANSDFLSSAAAKRVKERGDRAIKAASRVAQNQEISLVKSWLRDVMAICAGAPELVVNVDARAGLDDAAAHTDEARAAAAIRVADETSRMLAYNVSPQTCIDALLFDIREVLYDTNCPR